MNDKRNSPGTPLPIRAARMLERLENYPDLAGLSVEEKSVHALGLAATPEERWEMLANHNRSLGFWKPLKRTASRSC